MDASPQLIKQFILLSTRMKFCPSQPRVAVARKVFSLQKIAEWKGTELALHDGSRSGSETEPQPGEGP